MTPQSTMIYITLILSCVLLKRVTFSNINTVTYHVYQDLQLNDCHIVNLNTAKKSSRACAMFCSTDSNCAAFKFLKVSSDCMTCRRNEVTGLSFMTREFTSLPRVITQRNWPFKSSLFTNRSVAVPWGMKAGMVVHITGLVLTGEDFYINFEQADDQRDVNLHFRVRKDFDTHNPILVFGYCTSKAWGQETRPVVTPYPSKANTNTSLHFLVREDMFVLYIDNTLCCNYTYVPGMLYTKVNYIRVIGGIQVYEISS